MSFYGIFRMLSVKIFTGGGGIEVKINVCKLHFEVARFGIFRGNS